MTSLRRLSVSVHGRNVRPGRSKRTHISAAVALALVVSNYASPTLAALCGAVASPSSGAAPLTVHFNGVPSACERNRGKEFWIIDGVPHPNRVALTLTLSTPGNYPWEFCSWLAGCEQCCDSGTVRVEPSTSCRLDCNATATVLENTVPLVVDFQGNATPQSCPGATLEYEWDFGDLTSAVGPSARHEYSGPGPYYWTFRARYGAASCQVGGSARATCLRRGMLDFCADEIVNEPGSPTFTLRGNVHANDLLRFRGDVILTPDQFGEVLMSTGDLYVVLPGGQEVAIVRGRNLMYDVQPDEGRLDPRLGNPDFFAFDLGGLPLPLIVGGSPIHVSRDAVAISTVAVVGIPGILELSRIDTRVRFPRGDWPYLDRFAVLAGYVTPSISFAEVTGNYDGRNDRLDIRFVCRFPFSGGPSFVGTYGFDHCGPNRFDVTLGGFFEEGITITPMAPVRLKAGKDLVVRGDHICDREAFSIYVGTRATLCVETGVKCVSIPGEVFRIADLGLGYQHPFNFDIRGGTAQVLGFPVAGLRGRIQGNQPPMGMLTRGYARIPNIFEGNADLGWSFSRAMVMGSLAGDLTIQPFSCDFANIPCKMTKAMLRKFVGPLPARLANATLELAGRFSETDWSATAIGRVQLSNWPLVTVVQFAQEGIVILVGPNYRNLYGFGLQHEPETRSASTGESTVNVPEHLPHVLFGFSGNNAIPRPYLITPLGIRVDPENVSTLFPQAVYAVDGEEHTAVFLIPRPLPGTWRLGTDDAALNPTQVVVLAPKEEARVTWQRVERAGNRVIIQALVSPASAAAQASLEYTSALSGGLLGVVEGTMRDASAGLVTAHWDLSNLPTDTYFLRLVVRPPDTPWTVATWPSPFVVQRDFVAPPTNLNLARVGNGIRAEWNSPADPRVRGYLLLYTDTPDRPEYPLLRTVPFGTALTLTDLTPGKTYRFVVVAVDEEGRYSAPSNAAVVTVAEAACPGDCNNDGEVTIEEIIRGVNIALELSSLSTCSSFDLDGNGAVTVDEIIRGVNAALFGCSAPAPTPTVLTRTPSVTTATLAPSPSATPARTPSPTAPATVTPSTPRPSPTLPPASPTPTRTPTPSPTDTPAPSTWCAAPTTPISIPDNDPNGVSSTISVPSSRPVGRFRVRLAITHSWVGDLHVSLRHVATGTTVVLLDRPGTPPLGCGGDDVDCTFDDDATTRAADVCLDPPPAIAGAVRPAEALAAFAAETSGGEWVLTVADGAPRDTGALVSWCLELE